MDDLKSEKEQIEEMRAWWSVYGNYVLGGIAIAVAGLVGLNQYQSAKLDAYYGASALYDALADQIVDADVEAAEATSGELLGEYAESAYAVQGQLAMARLYMDENRDDDAANTLSTLLAGSAGEEFKHVARLRLAKILLFQEKAEEAAELVEGYSDGAFAERYAEAQGDAYVALGRLSDARAAYERALLESGTGATVDQNFVQLKLMDLPANVPGPDAEPGAESSSAEPADESATNDAAAAAEADGGSDADVADEATAGETTE